MKSGDSFYALAFYHDNNEIIKEALEKEKEQIMNAFLQGKVNHSKDWAIEYYNQTYKQEIENK
jgi:hypothetical protein